MKELFTHILPKLKHSMVLEYIKIYNEADYVHCHDTDSVMTMLHALEQFKNRVESSISDVNEILSMKEPKDLGHNGKVCENVLEHLDKLDVSGEFLAWLSAEIQ